MTQEEFYERYTAKSGVTMELIKENFIALPCDCGESGCQGWQMVTKRQAKESEENYGTPSTDE